MSCAVSIQPIAPGAYVPGLRPLPPPDAEPPRAGEPLPTAERSDALTEEGAAHLERLLVLSGAARARMDWEGARAAATAAAAFAGGVSEAWRSRALAERAGLALLAGAYDEAARDADEALALASDARERSRALLTLGVLAALAGDAAGAMARFAEAERAVGGRDPYGQLLLAINRSQAFAAMEDLAAAERAAAGALKLARREKDEQGTALAGMALASAQLARGILNGARSKLGEAARTFARAGDVLRQVQCHYLLGEIAYDSEDPIRAGAHYRDALALARPAAAVDLVELLTLRFEHR